MDQEIYGKRGSRVVSFTLPAPHEELMPGVRWGSVSVPFTPAFWKAKLRYACAANEYAYLRCSSRESLQAEVALQMLYEWAPEAEMTLEAFRVLRLQGVFSKAPSQDFEHIDLALSLVVTVDCKHLPAPRPSSTRKLARDLVEALCRLHLEQQPAGDREFKAWLETFAGIAPQTASRITRNWRQSKTVALIDDNVVTAGMIFGLYRPATPAILYSELEECFLAFAFALGEDPRRLDTMISEVVAENEILVQGCSERTAA